MRDERRGARRGHRGHARHAGPRSRLRRRHHRVAGREARRRRARASTSRATSSLPGTGGRGRRASPTAVPGGRRLEPRRPGRRLVRPDRQHLRRDVRAQAVRRGQGDGARHPARRPDRHGQLDPQRPDAGGADPQDQLGVLAAAAGGVRESDDVGGRERRHRTLRGAGVPAENISFVRDTYHVRLRRRRRPTSWPSSAPTTARR